MIHETDVLQAFGYAIVFRGRRYGEIVKRRKEWKAYIHNAIPFERPLNDAPLEWYSHSTSPAEALRLAFDDFREWALSEDYRSKEDIDAFERELFALFEPVDVLAAI